MTLTGPVFATVSVATLLIVVVADDVSVLVPLAVTPVGGAIVAWFVMLAVPLDVPLTVNVTDPPLGSVGTVVDMLLPAATLPGQTALPVALPHVVVTPVIAAGTVSVTVVPLASLGPLLLTTML